MTLRDDAIAYHQTHACDTRFSHKKLLLRVPLTTAEQLNPGHKHLDLFDATLYDADDNEDYIYLTLYPDYDVENDVMGEKGFRNTFNSPAAYAPANTRRGFKVTVKDHRKLIIDIIKQLADISETTSYRRYSPVKVVDFCHPEVTIASVYDGELATIRWGELVLDTNLPSLIKAKEDYLKKDWGFTFKETILRPGTMTFTTSPDITETQVVGGIDPNGDIKPIAVTEDGKLFVEGAGGSASGGATETTLLSVASRIQTGNETLTEILQELQDDPTGGATEATLVQVRDRLPSSGSASEATLQSILTELQQKTEPTNTQPVSAASLPLPTGASTEATLQSVATALAYLLAELQQKTEPNSTQQVAGTVNLGTTGSISTTSDIQAVRDRLPVTGALSEGTDITGTSMPSGGAGARGWFSAIYQILSNKLPALISGRIPVDANIATSSLATEVTLAQVRDKLISDPATAANQTTQATRLDLLLSEGADIAGTSVPAGGSGYRGWASAIWKQLNDNFATIIATTLAKGQQSMSGSLPVAIASNQSAIPIIGFTKSVNEIFASYTRPNDTIAYASNDALSDSSTSPTSLIFNAISRINGGTGYIVNAMCYANPTTFNGSLRLHLYRQIPANLIFADNTPFGINSNLGLQKIGYIDFFGFDKASGSGDRTHAIGAFPQSRVIPFSCNSNSTQIFGLVEVRAAFTPTANQIFEFYLGVEQN